MTPPTILDQVRLKQELPEKLYDLSFQRNLGLVSKSEQQILRNARVAIAGAGGVGGQHMTTLARLGVGRFNIADFDVFEPANINRQYGATTATLGEKKTEVMTKILHDINPEAEVRVFEEGVTPENVDAFLEGVDVVLDGIDFFAFDARRLLFNTARKKGIYVLTSGPVGFGATLQVFSPTGMGFDEFFGLTEDMSDDEKFVHFAVGIAAANYHRQYMDMSKIDIANHRAPALASACVLASGFIATEAINILLKRVPPVVIPRFFQFDPYLKQFKRGWIPFGARNPLQVIKRFFLRLHMRKLAEKQPLQTTPRPQVHSSGDY